MERWFDLVDESDDLATIVQKLSKEDELNKDKLSVKQIEHIIESIQYIGLDKGNYFIMIFDNVKSSTLVPTSGIINYLIAFIWLRNNGWKIKWKPDEEWVSVMLTPPDGGY